MPPKRGQIETLPGIVAPYGTSELAKVHSLSVITRPERWSEQVADYENITEQMIALANPHKLKESLVGPHLRTDGDRFVVDYECDDGSRQRVALNASEYSIVPRSWNLDRLGSSIASSTKKGRYAMAPSEIQERKVTDNQRRAFTLKYTAMKDRVHTIGEEIVLLQKVQEAAPKTWLARGRTDTLLTRVSQILAVSIPNALDVIGNQRGWSTTQRELAHRSLKHRLFFTQSEAERMQEWASLCEVLEVYDRCKIAVYKDRMGRIEGRFGKQAMNSATAR